MTTIRHMFFCDQCGAFRKEILEKDRQGHFVPHYGWGSEPFNASEHICKAQLQPVIFVSDLKNLIEGKKSDYKKLLCTSDNKNYRMVMDHKLATLESILSEIDGVK